MRTEENYKAVLDAYTQSGKIHYIDLKNEFIFLGSKEGSIQNLNSEVSFLLTGRWNNSKQTIRPVGFIEVITQQLSKILNRPLSLVKL